MHDVEHSLQACVVIAFVTALHDDIIDVAFYGFTYMLVEDRVHDALICRTSVLQAEGHYCVVVYSHRRPEGVCFSSSGYIFI